MHHLSTEHLLEARRALLESGEMPHGLVDDLLARSWLRSRQAGLSPLDHPGAPPISTGGDLRQAQARQAEFLAHARPVMEFVHDQMHDAGSMVVLANDQGLLLHALGDADFLQRAERVSLRPGALWHEHHRGTNAVGTALAERGPVVIHGAEHYLERNGFLTCSAAPVVAADGSLQGVLDISGDHRGYHPHTLALVRSAARMIEDRLFHARHPQDLLVRLHPRPEGLGAVGEGLVAVTEDGWVMGANALAQQWLDLAADQIGAITLDHLLGPHARRLQSLPATAPPTRVTTRRGQTLYARDEPERRRRVWATGTTTSPRARGPLPGPASPRALRRDEGREDARVTQALLRALKVQAQGIPVLLQGDSGTGKDVFARTLHAEGERASRPFVAVQCAERPQALLEAELFGYVGGAIAGGRPEGAPGGLRQAGGGTLLLDEIDELPLPLQARLLRTLNDGAVVPMGGCEPVPVDAVLVCASRRPLREAVARGAFREDLYWRLKGLTVQMPPLRERGDMVRLVEDMLQRIGQDMHRPQSPTIADEVLQALMQHPWPGNLRQLHAVLRTACALLSPGERELHWEHFSEDVWDDVFSRPYREDDAPAAVPANAAPPGTAQDDETNLKRLSHSAIERTVQACHGNMSEAARRLGISRNTLYRRLKRTA